MVYRLTSAAASTSDTAVATAEAQEAGEDGLERRRRQPSHEITSEAAVAPTRIFRERQLSGLNDLRREVEDAK